jgi:sec-independent protein translocase protein TatA
MTLALPGLPDLGAPELIIIVLVLLLLFGGRKLPEVARGTGRALRIFKAETKGLMTDDDDDKKETATQQAQLPQQGPAPAPQPAPPTVEQQATTVDQPRTES